MLRTGTAAARPNPLANLRRTLGTVESGFDSAAKEHLRPLGGKFAPGTGHFGGYGAILRFDAAPARLPERQRHVRGRLGGG